MKTTYMLKVDEDFKPCIADLSKSIRCGHWYISRINVPWKARGNGYGSQLLQQIIKDADAEGAGLCLLPIPTGGMKSKALRSWYKRYGFVFHDPNVNSCVMIRKPGKE
jgi:GNAT superfamily N-acetyltransferase